MSTQTEDSREEDTTEHCNHCSEHEGDDEQQREEERDDDEQEDTEEEHSHASLREDTECPMQEDNSFYID